MFYFKNDYSQIAHPRILENLCQYNVEDQIGYGQDDHSTRAKALIQQHINKPVAIHFVTGGTVANKIVLAHLLKPYEAVIACHTSHINVHETGAIEATGHKIITVQGINGKITAESIQSVCQRHVDEHMVVPRVVYLSQATELGTVYSKAELLQIYRQAKTWGLLVFIDGARLGAALACLKADLTLNELAHLCDAFYIGGTKNGALLGEAIVLCNAELFPCFRHTIKQNGGMYAKGFVTGIQFETLWQDDLYYKLADHANQMAARFVKGLEGCGIFTTFLQQTNQIFITVSKQMYEVMLTYFVFEVWENIDEEHIIIRLVTSWATQPCMIDDAIQWFQNYLSKG